uniref:ATP synthase subunit d, mitochondrial n=1 Tax=Maconellicoccus hirsutus TaxID=177089 RepID=A2I3U9_MACHI|nr:hypothetical protein [Maconellicoccus hirsutus]
MASKRIGKFTVDWLDLAQRVPSTQKSNYQVFKARSDGFLRKVLANPEEPPKIDWAFYKSNAVNKAVIEQLEKLYTSTKIPYPDDKGAYASLAIEEKNELEKVEKFIKASSERIKKFEKDIEAIRSVPSYEEMTLEEYAYHHPNLALNPLEKPTFWPHTEDTRIPPDLLAYHRKMGQMHGPDKYHP